MMTLHVVTALCCRGTVLLAPPPCLATPRKTATSCSSFPVFEQRFSFWSRPASKEEKHHDSRVRRRSTGLAKESRHA